MHAHSTPPTQKAFTIVELLIVIVVIAILAAIGVVAYSGVQQRASIASLQTTLRQNWQQVAMYHAEEGSYPTAASQLASLDIRFRDDMVSPGGNSAVYCHYDGQAAFLFSGRIQVFGDENRFWAYGSSGLVQMDEWYGSNNQRCNAVVPGSGGSGGNMVNGRPGGEWASWITVE